MKRRAEARLRFLTSAQECGLHSRRCWRAMIRMLTVARLTKRGPWSGREWKPVRETLLADLQVSADDVLMKGVADNSRY